jgi:hypothetical protein
MNPLIKEFLTFSKRFEELKEELKKISPKLNEIMEELGIDEAFQDPETGVVYKIERPKGTFVEYKQIGYVRTKKDSEKRGTLSKKEAEGMGFRV